MEDAAVPNLKQRQEWFSKFRNIPNGGATTETDLALNIFDPPPRLREEDQPVPVPLLDPRYALGRQQIVAHAHPPSLCGATGLCWHLPRPIFDFR